MISNGTQLKKLVLKGLNRTYDSLSTNIRKDRASFTKLKAIYYQKTLKKLVFQSRIFCKRWNGLDKTNGRLEALDDREFEGGLLFLIQSGEDFIKKNSTNIPLDEVKR